MTEIFFDVIMLATIFSKMGDGKNTGKLIFKSLFSSTGFSIEDGESALTFSSTGGGGNAVVTVNQVAFGTGTGITSSVKFVVSETSSYESIYGFSSLRQDPDILKSSYIQNFDNYGNLMSHNFGVGGNCNKILQSNLAVTIGGYYNEINYGYGSSVIGGHANKLYKSPLTSILSGTNNKTKYSCYSTIISSSSSQIYSGAHSRILSSKSSKIISKYESARNNSQNVILSSTNVDIQSDSKSYLTGNVGCERFNTILSSEGSCILLSATGSGVSNSVKTFITPNVCGNTIISDKNSFIGNSGSYDGQALYNLIFSGCENITHQKFSTISGRCNKLNSYDLISKPATYGLYGQILASNKSYMHTSWSSIIGSIGSTSSAGLDTNSPVKFNNIIGGSYHCTRCVTGKFYYNSILGGRSNCTISSSILNVLIAGERNRSEGRSIIIGGCRNRTSQGSTEKMKVFGLTSGAPPTYENARDFRDGIVVGGSYNLAAGYSIVLGGQNNYSAKRSLILGGSNNWTAFQFKPSYTDYFGDQDFPGIFSVSQDFIIGGNKNCATSGFTSIIIGGECNVTRNANDSVIIGGCCNFIEAHGDFSGKEKVISGFTFSELRALYELALFYKPSFTPPNLGGWIGTTSYLRCTSNYVYGVGCYQTQVNNNFIIGGYCNSFGSNFPGNYQTGLPYNFLYGGTSNGLSPRATSFILNSGIVGGTCNKIVNSYSIYDATAAVGGQFPGTLVNSVILGGCGLTLSHSNRVCTDNAIFADQVCVKSVKGVSGNFVSPTQICICGGLIVGVTTSDLRLKIIIQKIGQSNSNLNIYLFKYISDPEKIYQGVIAQELLNTKYESAVSTGRGGFYQVDYSKIDVEFKEVSMSEMTSNSYQ